jgi:hypothetical protein
VGPMTGRLYQEKVQIELFGSIFRCFTTTSESKKTTTADEWIMCGLIEKERRDGTSPPSEGFIINIWKSQLVGAIGDG